MIKRIIGVICLITICAGYMYSNDILRTKYKEAERYLKAMKMIEQEVNRINRSPKRKYLVKRLWTYKKMLKELRVKVKSILGLAQYNFIDFNLHYIYKLRQHYKALVDKMKGVHLLDSSQKIMQLLEYSVEEFLLLMNKVDKYNGKKLFKELEKHVFDKLVELHGRPKAKKKLNELFALFKKLEKDIFNEVIEIVRFITRYQKPIKDFVRTYKRMTSDQRMVYIQANKDIVKLIVHVEDFITSHAIRLRDSKTHKPLIDKIIELTNKYYPGILRN